MVLELKKKYKAKQNKYRFLFFLTQEKFYVWYANVHSEE